MHRRTFLSALVASAGSTLGVGCSRAQPLVVGIHPWIGYEPLYLAREFGWLPPAVTLREGAVAGDSLAALAAGQVEAAALTLDEVFIARAQGIPLVVVTVLDVSAGADVVIAREDVEGPAGLAGLTIAVERSALGGLMLAKTLEAAGLASTQVEVLDIPPNGQLAAWRLGRIDAAVTYEPTASLLEQAGGHRVFDSRSIPDTIFDVLAVRRDRLGAAEDTLRDLVQSHFQALDHLRVNRQDAVYRIATRQGIDPGDVNRALAGVRLPGPAGNRRYLAPGSPLDRAAADLNRLMVNEGLMPAADSMEDLYTARFLPLR